MIYIDLDSTLNNLIYAWIDWCNKNEEKNFTIKDVKTWRGLEKLYSNPYEFFKIKPYKNNLVQPFEGAKKLIENLKEFDKVCIISDTYKHQEEEKSYFIENHFGKIPKILSSFDKELYINKNDILIDDNFENVYKVLKKKNAKCILFKPKDYQYNDFIFNNVNFKKATNYIEIYKYVKEFYIGGKNA